MMFSRSYVCFFFAVLARVAVKPAVLQGCGSPLPEYKTFNETDEPGLELLRVDGVANTTWTFTVVDPSVSLNSYFRLENSSDRDSIILVLNQTFDLETVYDQLKKVVTSIRFRITCSQPGDPDINTEWFAFVEPVNEFTPTLENLPSGGINILEDAPVHSTVLVLKDYVKDQDVQPNPIGFDYELLPFSNSAEDGRSKFTIENSVTGAIALKASLDYEAMPPGLKYYMLNVSFGDREGLTSHSLIRINVMDADDQPPEFYDDRCSSPCFISYSAAIRADFTGPITWLEPDVVKARDRDTLGSAVMFSIKKGEPASFANYLIINQISGEVTVTQPIDDNNITSFLLIIEAVENTTKRNSEQTTLWLLVEGRNRTLPTLPPEIISMPTTSSNSFYVAAIVMAVLLAVFLAAFFIVIIIFAVRRSRKPTPLLPTTERVLSPGSLGHFEETNKSAVDGKAEKEMEGSGSRTTGQRRRRNSNDSRMEFMRPPSHERVAPPEPSRNDSSMAGYEDMASTSRDRTEVTTRPECEDLARPADDGCGGVSNPSFQSDSSVASEIGRTRM